jgi:exopolysaccharide production protein ExoQ
MSPNIAASFCSALICVLFLLERDRKSRVSWAMWIPVIWLTIAASRSVSQWLGGVVRETQDQVVEGNLLDALIFLGLTVAGLMVLIGRRRQVRALLRANAPLLTFLGYCALSVMWSDYPLSSFKRWFKAVGDLIMILIVVTDPEPTAAIKRFLSRPGFLLVPLSILFIKDFPSLGRGYSAWTGEAYNNGVATQKNGLGYICLIFGLASFWCLIEALRKRGRARTNKPIIANLMLLALALWLFQMAHSATSFSCFLIGAGFITVTTLFRKFRQPVTAQLLVGFVLFVVVYGMILNPAAGLTEAVGRDATLTGRTSIWHRALALVTNPLFGTGYESFWTGTRLLRMSDNAWERPGQAHNGYLDVYLNLGWVGVGLLGFAMFTGLRSFAKTLRWDQGMDRLKLGFFVIAAIYNLTEHAFRELHPVWIVFLLAIIVVPKSLHEGAAKRPPTQPGRIPLAEEDPKEASLSALATRGVPLIKDISLDERKYLHMRTLADLFARDKITSLAISGAARMLRRMQKVTVAAGWQAGVARPVKRLLSQFFQQAGVFGSFTLKRHLGFKQAFGPQCPETRMFGVLVRS